MSNSSQLRLTMVFDFNYYGEVTQESMDRLVERFMADPSEFTNPETMEWDEKIYVDIALREDEDAS